MRSEIRSIDFSIWHPLDHWPWEKRCREHHGGPRNHLKLTWEYRRKPWLLMHTICKVGIHLHEGTVVDRPYGKPNGRICMDCGARLS